MFLPVEVHRGDGTVKIPRPPRDLDSTKTGHIKYRLPVENNATIRNMRMAFMEKAGKLTRASLNLRVGLQSAAKSQVDWDFCSSWEEEVPVGDDLAVRAGAVVEQMRGVRWAGDFLRSEAETCAWKQMMGVYLTGVVPFGRYNLPDAERQANAIYENWKHASIEYMKQREGKATGSRTSTQPKRPTSQDSQRGKKKRMQNDNDAGEGSSKRRRQEVTRTEAGQEDSD